MFKLPLIGALLLALVSPVAAQECDTLVAVQGILDSQGSTNTVVPADDMQGFIDGTVAPLLGEVPEGVTSVLVAIIGDVMVFGLEIDGCMSPPFAFAKTGPSA